MKKNLLAISLLTILSSSLAWAVEPVANIQVTGAVKPPTCTINGGDNDILFDYGRISPSMIPQSNNYQLPVRTATITVLCDANTYLTFTPTDSYTISTADKTILDEVFGVVDASDTTKEVGFVGYSLSNLTVDDKPAFAGRYGANTAVSPSTWWGDSLIRNAVIGWTSELQTHVSSPSQLKLISGKKFDAKISTGTHQTAGGVPATAILSRDKLTANGIELNEGVDFIGQVTLAFSFGV